MPSARGMQTACQASSLASHATMPVTGPKRPTGWAPWSDASTSQASRAPGQLAARLHRWSRGEEPMTPLWSTWPASPSAPASPRETGADASSPPVGARRHPTGQLSPRHGSRPLAARTPRGARPRAARSGGFAGAAVHCEREGPPRPPPRRRGRRPRVRPAGHPRTGRGGWRCPTRGPPAVGAPAPCASAWRVLAAARRTWARAAETRSLGRLGVFPGSPARPAGHATAPDHPRSARPSWPTYTVGARRVRGARSGCAVSPWGGR